MNWQVFPFDAERDTQDWDALCRAAPMATFLHTRAFLSYHGERFEDASLVVRDDRGQLIAALPAAREPGGHNLVCTHPGASFGGLVHAGDLLGEPLMQVLARCCRTWHAAGFTGLRYKLVPHIYHRWPANDDQYALWRLGATLTRCNLSSSIDLAARREPGSRRRRALRTAQAAGLSLHVCPDRMEAFWPVLISNLADRHDGRPVHSLDEMRLLASRFPDEIILVTATHNDEVAAGVLLFTSPQVSHAQYIACSASGRKCNALDAVFEYCIAQARTAGCRYFDFGISNEDEGRHLNAGLYTFKSEFGGGGVAHHFYELSFDAQLVQRCATILGDRP